MITTPQQINPPDTIDLLKALKKEVFSEINCINIGVIDAFDAATQTATIQLSLKSIQDIQADGTRIIKERPVLLECPVMVLSGGVSHVTLPVTKGDTCIVLFNDREIDNWFVNGGLQTPTSFRKHDLSDGLAVVGIRNIQNAINDYLEGGLRMRYNEESQIDLTEALIESTATLFKHNGDIQVTNDATINNDLKVDNNADIIGTLTANLVDGDTVTAGNGTSGTFSNSVTVVNGIVTAGT